MYINFTTQYLHNNQSLVQINISKICLSVDFCLDNNDANIGYKIYAPKRPKKKTPLQDTSMNVVYLTIRSPIMTSSTEKCSLDMLDASKQENAKFCGSLKPP